MKKILFIVLLLLHFAGPNPANATEPKTCWATLWEMAASTSASIKDSLMKGRYFWLLYDEKERREYLWEQDRLRRDAHAQNRAATGSDPYANPQHGDTAHGNNGASQYDGNFSGGNHGGTNGGYAGSDVGGL